MKLARLITFFIATLLAFISPFFYSLQFIFSAAILMLIHNLIFSLENIKKRLVFAGFQCTIYIFLMGAIFPSFLQGKGFGLNFREDIDLHIAILLYLSFVFLFFGQYLGEMRGKKVFIGKNNLGLGPQSGFNPHEDMKRLYIRSISRILYYLFYIPWIAGVAEKVIFVQRFGYLSYYTGFQSRIPSIILRAGNMAEICLFIFLATMPTKKEVRLPIFLYVFFGILSIGYGQRNPLALVVLVIIIYYIYRNKSDGEIWFGRKQVVYCLIGIPTLMAFFGIYQYIRSGVSSSFVSPLDAFLGFFEETGGSVKVLGYAKSASSIFQPDRMYSLFALTDYLKNNIISEFLFHFKTFKENTVELAVQSNNFGAAITYYVMPRNYLLGVGMGSSYMAEVFVDFGYFGVILINILYGFIMGRISNINKNKIYTFALSLCAIKMLMFTPRYSSFSFITETLSFSNLGVILFVNIVCILMIQKNGGKTMKIVSREIVRPE